MEIEILGYDLDSETIHRSDDTRRVALPEKERRLLTD